MSEKNGNGFKVILWIFAIIVFPTLFFIGSAVIANDAKSLSRDDKIYDNLTEFKAERNKVTQEILVALAEMRVDLKYIKEKIK